LSRCESVMVIVSDLYKNCVFVLIYSNILNFDMSVQGFIVFIVCWVEKREYLNLVKLVQVTILEQNILC